MSLVKWFRKNNTKIMAVVVIVLMVGFIGGSALTYLLRSNRGMSSAVATLAGKKITNSDLLQARQELELLRMVGADEILRAQGLQGVFLAELLFSGGRGSSPSLIGQIRQAVRRNMYAISDRQIDDIYRRRLPPSAYWYCLKNEAQRAGIGIRNSEVGTILGRAIPQLFRGQTYSQVIGSIIDKQRIPENQILATTGQLLNVLQYSQIMCSTGNVTTRETMNELAIEQDSLDVGYVALGADTFVDPNAPAPSEEQLAQQFDKYKDSMAGVVTDENPYGFGYKLPPRVKLEYIAVKLSDVRGIITPPTQDEIGEYYSSHKQQLFTEQVPVDPNDPNSPTKERVKSYAEVADSIAKQLLTDKIDSKADSILQEAATLTEIPEEEQTAKEPTPEQLKEKDYKVAAQKLDEKYKIKVYAGQTGLLDALDMQLDRYLGMLFLQGYGQHPVELSRVVFAVDDLGASELGPYDVPKPRLYENIGPLKSPYGGGIIMAMVRVVEAEKGGAPQDINVTYSTRTLTLDPNEPPADKDVYSVKDQVVEDLKKLGAMDLTKKRADEFANLATMDGWDKALGVFEKLYGRGSDPNDNDPNVFSLRNNTGMRRLSPITLQALAVQSRGQPTMTLRLPDIERNNLFANKLYNLVPADSNTVENLPVVMEFKPDFQYLVIKDISIKRLWKERYEEMKTAKIFGLEHVETQSLAAVFFNPANILKRVNFKQVEGKGETADANEPNEPEVEP
jgi:hypothetical protein